MNESTEPEPGAPDEIAAPGGPAASPPPYRFSPRVLQRWARSNLTLTEPGPEGDREATFRYHGSTCGNIEFDLLYRVTIGPADSGWIVRSQRCEPAPHGDGHTRMCCWRESDAMVRDWMDLEAPLKDKPLMEALAWDPAKSASGCLCHVNGRMHKWSAVLQTLYYKLTQS
ncbi:MAG: hypothetical protein SynsKO_11020 [Synoicihabitans sp.]